MELHRIAGIETALECSIAPASAAVNSRPLNFRAHRSLIWNPGVISVRSVAVSFLRTPVVGFVIQTRLTNLAVFPTITLHQIYTPLCKRWTLSGCKKVGLVSFVLLTARRNVN